MQNNQGRQQIPEKNRFFVNIDRPVGCIPVGLNGLITLKLSFSLLVPQNQYPFFELFIFIQTSRVLGFKFYAKSMNDNKPGFAEAPKSGVLTSDKGCWGGLGVFDLPNPYR